nr:hypothetical protein [Stieleria neptunia]
MHVRSGAAPQLDFARPRNPGSARLGTLARQILVAALIILTALIRLMLLAIDLNDQLQVHTTEINGVRFNRVFAPKLLISTTAIAQHLPDISGELICAGTLIAGE